jgi:hypothetical protein
MRSRVLIIVALVLGVVGLVYITGRKSHDPVAVSVSITNAPPATQSTFRKTARTPVMAEPAEMAAPATTSSLFERLRSGETNLNLTTEQLAEYLRQYGTNVETLLATQNKDYIRLAAELYPDDPRVQYAVVTRDIFPEAQRREWLDRFKRSAPDNAIADYLSARDYLKAGDRENALKDLAHAAGKSRLEDYAFGQIADMEDAQLSAGRTIFEAKVAAHYELHLPHFAMFRDLAKDIQQIQKEHIAAGDTASAATLAQLGRSLSQQLLQGESSRLLVGQQVGIIVERALLNQLPPNSQPSFLNGTVQQRLDEMTAHRQHLREVSAHFTDLMARGDETEIISYLDRAKVQGEYRAMRWLQDRARLRPPE